MFVNKNCLYIGREKEHSEKIQLNEFVLATYLIINFCLDHPVDILYV